MKRKLLLIILFVFFTTSFMSLLGCNNQNPTKEQKPKQSLVPEKNIKEDNELQEQCLRRSKEYFNKEYGNEIVITKDGMIIRNYTNRYNRKQNKCFLLLTSTYTFNNKKEDNLLLEDLLDINENNENKEYGYYVGKGKKIGCFVLDKECKTEEEWNSLVKPFMEN